MNKNIVGGIGIVLALVLSVLGLTRTPTNTTTIKNVPGNVGAASGPILPYNYFGFGDVIEYRAKTTALTQSSNLPCALQAPAATSTLVMATIRESVASTTIATTLTMVKATSTASILPLATMLSTSTIASNSQGILTSATSTAVNTATGVIARLVATDRIFAPNEWLLVYQYQSAFGVDTAGTVSPTGVCQATWEAI